MLILEDPLIEAAFCIDGSRSEVNKKPDAVDLEELELLVAGGDMS
jgi:hypothetical protein